MYGQHHRRSQIITSPSLTLIVAYLAIAYLGTHAHIITVQYDLGVWISTNHHPGRMGSDFFRCKNVGTILGHPLLMLFVIQKEYTAVGDPVRQRNRCIFIDH